MNIIDQLSGPICKYTPNPHDESGEEKAMTQITTKYIYIFVRTDLTIPQIAVQACHAAIESSRQHLTPDLEHPHIVLCGIESESKLFEAHNRIQSFGFECCVFYEPDLNNSLTAFATELVDESCKRYFKKFQLLRFSEEFKSCLI